MHQSRCCNLLPFSCDVYWVALNLDVEYTEYIYYIGRKLRKHRKVMIDY